MYLVVRVHGLKLHLLTDDQLLSLADLPDFASFVNALAGTEYKAEIAGLGPRANDPVALEKAFYGKLANRLGYLVKAAPSKLAGVIAAFARRVEVENVTRILRAKHAGKMITREELLPVATKTASVDFETLLAAKSVPEILESLRKTPYEELAAQARAYEEAKDLGRIELALKRLYYISLWESANRAPSKEALRRLLGAEVDLVNIMMLLLMKAKGAEAEEVEAALVPVYRHELPERVIEQLIPYPKERVLDGLVETGYAYLLPALREPYARGELSAVEHAIFEELRRRAVAELRSEPFSASYILAYAYLCEFEAKNLTTLALSKYLGLEKEKVKKSLILRR